MSCRASNPHLCREHKLPVDFTEVPAYVVKDVAKLKALRIKWLDLQSQLETAALLEGILPSEVGYAAWHHPNGAIALRTLMLAAQEAEYQYDKERERQNNNATEYANQVIFDMLPENSDAKNWLLCNLVILRFLLLEGDEEEYEEVFGVSRKQFFKPLKKPQVREALHAANRAFLSLMTASIPEQETLNSLLYECVIRMDKEPSESDTNRALDVLDFALSGGEQGEPE